MVRLIQRYSLKHVYRLRGSGAVSSAWVPGAVTQVKGSEGFAPEACESLLSMQPKMYALWRK